MDALIVYPENAEQLTAIKAVMTAMQIGFEQRKSVQYPPYVLQGLKTSLKQVEEEKIYPYNGIADMLGK